MKWQNINERAIAIPLYGNVATDKARINPTIATVPETLTQADRDQAMFLIAQLRDILPPLQDITAEERQ